MNALKEIRKWLGLLFKPLGIFLPPQVKLIYQAVLIGIDAFIMAYKTARQMQANKIKQGIKESAEAIKKSGLTPEERLKLNAEMEKHFRHFVDKPTP